MFTKSKIQLIKESIEIANDYKESLNNLMDKYNIEDNIFIYKSGKLFEVTQGYFIENKEYTNLTDAIYDCLIDHNQNMGIRIIENQKFIVGIIQNTIPDKYDQKVLDITKLSFI